MKDTNDLFNVELTKSIKDVDFINKKFYGKYNYPWPPKSFPKYPSGLALNFLNQDVGSWDFAQIGEQPKIWVAGCGTNQAIYTALRYPEASVLGTDISPQSLKQCKKIANEIGIENLSLEEGSLNDVEYKEKFDFIICTGVIHHNYNPEMTLQNISKALKRNGVMEFMVYNYYHRVFTTACQKAVRSFYKGNSSINMEHELDIIKRLMSEFPTDTMMGEFMNSYRDAPEARLADSLLQPVEFSYTIETMDKMLSAANLEFLLHCVNQFDAVNNEVNWNLSFSDKYLDKEYYSLPDIKRWQITNLLMLSESPMLWFYVQRRDSSNVRKSEKEVCNQFLKTRFQKNTFPIKNYVINTEGKYENSNMVRDYPIPSRPKDLISKKVWDEISPEYTMKDILEKLKIEQSFERVNELRIRLTTLQFPYLIAVR